MAIIERPSRDPLSFLPGVAERLGYYVYALRDPRTGAVFYVGKGQGDRVFQHARYAKRVPGSENAVQLKLDRIREIQESGRDVVVEIIRHGLDEVAAFHVEAAVIDALRLLGVDLANAVSGHQTDIGWHPLEEIVSRYAAHPITIADEHRVILVRINREFRFGMSELDLYEATRKWWANNLEKRNPEWAFAVCYGIVRGVYKIARWERSFDFKPRPRVAFVGDRSEVMENRYLWTDVSSYFRAGEQSPIKYVNC